MNVILRVRGHGINREVVEGMGELIEPLDGIVDEEATDEKRNLAPTQHSNTMKFEELSSHCIF